jgi:GDP-4-dehydro-6-deoxy-D-mannose reductase
MRAMLERGWEVTAGGIGAPSGVPVLDAAQRDAVRWVPMDVTRQDELAAAVDTATPDIVLHLAAISHVPDAMRNPGYAYEVNTVGTVRLLAEVGRVRRAGRADPMVLVIGSSEQYGRHELVEMPLAEEAEQRPLTLYAASKLAQEVAALQAVRSEGLRVVCTRSFSHSGAGHAPNFLLPGLVRRALALPREGGQLTIGNGDTMRDFLHVADVVDAYLSLLDVGVAGEVYNVSSGARRVSLAAGRCLCRHFHRSGVGAARGRARTDRQQHQAPARNRMGTPPYARGHHRRPDSCRDALTSIVSSSSAPAPS